MEIVSEKTRKKMSDSARRRCTSEWREKRSETLSTPINGELLRRLYTLGFTQIEIAKILNMTQKIVWGYMRRHKISARKAAKRNQYGKNNSMWKGDKAGYSALHLRVQALRGRPQKCEVCGATDKSLIYDWASLTGNYANPEDYMRMCRSCHWKYDKTILNIKHMREGGAKCQRAS